MPNFIETELSELAAQHHGANSKIKPWQAALKAGDCFYYYSNTFEIVVWGEVLEDQNDPTMYGYRECRCYVPGLPDGMTGAVHVSVIHKCVTRETFQLAEKAGWPHDEITFIKFAASLYEDKTKN